METSFGLTPHIHSYNALLCAFGKLHKRDEEVKVFEHLVCLGVKPNAKSYALLIDAHLIKRDPKAAHSTVNDMVVAGFESTKEILKKVSSDGLGISCILALTKNYYLCSFRSSPNLLVCWPAGEIFKSV